MLLTCRTLPFRRLALLSTRGSRGSDTYLSTVDGDHREQTTPARCPTAPQWHRAESRMIGLALL